MKPKGRNVKAPLSLRQNISIARSLLGTRSPHLLEIPLLDVLASYVGVSKPQSTLSVVACLLNFITHGMQRVPSARGPGARNEYRTHTYYPGCSTASP